MKSIFAFLILVSISIFYLNLPQLEPLDLRERSAPEPAFNFQSLFGFVENKGQIKNQYGQTNTAVRYQFSGDDLKVQLQTRSFCAFFVIIEWNWKIKFIFVLNLYRYYVVLITQQCIVKDSANMDNAKKFRYSYIVCSMSKL